MAAHVKRLPPALKHACYAATSLLPGESAAEFEKLRRDLIDELGINGVLENEVATELARVVWREKNLATFRIAKLARARCEQIKYEMVPTDKIEYDCLELGRVIERIDPAVREAAIRSADDQARKELGELYALVEIGKIATSDSLTKELDVRERLGRRKVQLLKELVLLRGVKSISLTSAATSSTPPKQLSAA